MKTKSSTTWCNLYSTASKYNLCIKRSRYRNLLIFGGSVFISLLWIGYATYAYQFILMIGILTVAIISALIAMPNHKQPTKFHIALNDQGVCSFEHTLDYKVANLTDKKEQFQLLASSRYSFFGCWLHVVSLSNLTLPELSPKTINQQSQKKWLFIYRDSLDTENFSQLTKVIRTLKNIV